MSIARLCILALGLAAVANCAGPERRLVTAMSSNGPAMRQAMEMAAEQVRHCYRSPRVSSAGRQIVTRLRVEIVPGGALSGLPAVISQSGVNASNEAYAPRMAEAAIESVLRCAPLRLPPDVQRDALVVIDLTFSPFASA